MQVYLLKYQSRNKASYLVIHRTPQQRYLVSAIDIKDHILTYIYRYGKNFTEYYSGSYFLLSVYHLYYHSDLDLLSLDVFALNITGISLYIWLNYQILIQRKVYSDTSSKYNLALVYVSLQSRNFSKRYLIFRD